jgi:GDP-L-fucose synthase
MPEDIIVKGITSNLLINSQAFEACYDNKIKKIVWISSTTAYPYKDKDLKESEIFNGDPIEEYFSIGWTTRFIEKLCIIYAKKLKRKMSIAIIRPTCIYGENEGFDLSKCHVLPAMVKKIIERMEPIEIWGDGEQKRDFVHANDVASVCVTLLSSCNSFDSFNIGTGNYYSVNDIINIICNQLGIKDLKTKYIKTDRKIEMNRKISSEKIKRKLNFQSSIDIYEGITRLIREYKNNNG